MNLKYQKTWNQPKKFHMERERRFVVEIREEDENTRINLNPEEQKTKR